MIPAMRMFLVVLAALMFSAPLAHAGLPFAGEFVASGDVAAHCTHEDVAACDETQGHHEVVDHHGADEGQGQSCCSISCHVGVQPCFGHTAFLAMTKTAHAVRPIRDMMRLFVTNLDRPPRLV